MVFPMLMNIMYGCNDAMYGCNGAMYGYHDAMYVFVCVTLY